VVNKKVILYKITHTMHVASCTCDQFSKISFGIKQETLIYFTLFLCVT